MAFLRRSCPELDNLSDVRAAARDSGYTLTRLRPLARLLRTDPNSPAFAHIMAAVVNSLRISSTPDLVAFKLALLTLPDTD